MQRAGTLGEESSCIFYKSDQAIQDSSLMSGLVIPVYMRCLQDAEYCNNKIISTESTIMTWQEFGALQVENAQKSHKIFEDETMSIVASLKACAKRKDLLNGSRIHSRILQAGLLQKNVHIGTILVHMYAKCGAIAKAHDTFHELPSQDVVSWTALIAGCVQHGNNHEALRCFQQMLDEGFSPNAITFTCILKACGSAMEVCKGREIHAEVVRQGLLKRNSFVGNALVDMYVKCGMLAEAEKVFNELLVRDVVSWNVIMTGYNEQGHALETVFCFEKMQYEGISPSAITFTCVLKACASTGSLGKGEEVHAEVARQGLVQKEPFIGSALIDMYAKCGSLAKALEVFNELPVRNIVSWSALIAGYAQHGHGHEALTYFVRMQQEGVPPDAVTFTCALKACGIVGAAQMGEKIHDEVSQCSLLKANVFIDSVLIDMYAKCGLHRKAQEVFDEHLVQDVVSWNALVAGYAQLGEIEIVLTFLVRMLNERIQPDLITFILLLNTCSHSGLVEEGQIHFGSMSKTYPFVPALEHYACMVDLFSRARLFEKAVKVIEQIQSSDFPYYVPLWYAVLGLCRKWGNVKLGQRAFEHVIELDVKDAEAYICMSNIYADASMQDEVNDLKFRRMRNEAYESNGMP